MVKTKTAPRRRKPSDWVSFLPRPARQRSKGEGKRAECVSLEPPSESQVESVDRRHDRAPVAVDDIVELDGYVGVRLEGYAADPCGPIELRQRYEPVGHLVLSVEPLVACEQD